MNHSKYNPKYDPKNSAYQPQTTAPVEQLPAVAPAVDTLPAQAVESPLAMQTPAAITDKDLDASISDSNQPATGQGLHAEREPSALTGGLPELPAAQTDSETGEKTPALSAKPIS
jgi:hypothetical protein